MADRHWVAGNGSWDGTAGTKWSATADGPGGASVPTTADDVFIGSSELGNIVITIAAGNLGAKSITLQSGFDEGTLAGTAAITVAGSVTLRSAPIITYSGTLTLSGTGTLTTAGKTIGSVVVNGSGITVTLGGALTSSGGVVVTQGTLTTNNFNVTALSLSSSNSNTRTINLGSSTVTLTSTSGFVMATTTGLTFNAGTSSIVLSGSGSTKLTVGSPQTFHNVSFTSSALTTPEINGQCTFNNLTVAGRNTAGVTVFVIDSNHTINGTLTLSAGTNATMRTFVRSDTIGTPRTLTCAAVASLTDIDFRDITIAGASAPVSGTRLGDCKGNSGITFPAGKNVYYNAANGVSWNNLVIWALTPGGAVSGNNFPLAQDTVIFTATAPTSGQTITINASYNIGTIDMSARTSNTMTLATSTNTPTIYGNWINGTGTTLTGTGTLTFAGRGSQTITSAGKAFTQNITVDSPGGVVQAGDAFSTTGTVITTLTQGTLSGNGYNVTGYRFASSNSNTRTIAVGSGTWTYTGGGTAFNCATSTGLTVTGTGTISLTSASAQTFAGGGIQTYPTINQGGTGTLTVTGSNRFANITNTAIGRVQFTGGTTNEFSAFNLNGTSTAARLPLGSTNTTQVTLTKPTAWDVGTGSLDSGNNTGLFFVAGGNNFLDISYVIGVVVGGIAASVIESAVANTTESAAAVFFSSMNETTTATDTNAAGMIFLGTLSESATAADVVAVAESYFRSITEAATAADLVSATVVFASAIAELTNATDLAEALRTTQASVSETIQATETAAAAKIFQSAISETTVATEIAAALKLFNAAILEATTAVEVQAAQAAFLAAVPEQVSGADVAAAFITAGVSVAEGTSITDAVLGAYLWNPIDDTQNPNWQNVVNTQGSGWAQVNTDDTPNWQPTIEP